MSIVPLHVHNKCEIPMQVERYWWLYTSESMKPMFTIIFAFLFNINYFYHKYIFWNDKCLIIIVAIICERQLNFAPPSHHRVGIATEDSCQLREDRRETEIGSDWRCTNFAPLSQLFLLCASRNESKLFFRNSILQTR